MTDSKHQAEEESTELDPVLSLDSVRGGLEAFAATARRFYIEARRRTWNRRLDAATLQAAAAVALRTEVYIRGVLRDIEDEELKKSRQKLAELEEEIAKEESGAKP